MIKIAIPLALLFLFSPKIFAHGIWFGLGTSNAEWHWENNSRSETYRIAAIFDTPVDWELLEKYNISLQTETGFFHWQDTKWGDKDGIVIAPVFNYPIENTYMPLTLRFGIGASYRNGQQWADRKLGSRWLFEDRIELSAEFTPRHSLGLTFFHYSNAGLADDNWGANVYNLNYHYQW